MITTGSIAEIREIRRSYGMDSIGLVPTMGYLHDGHLELVRRAAAENDRVVVTIFVNPKQFSPTEDLASYPRDMERDLQLLNGVGVDLVFAPSVETMYPADFQSTVSLGTVTRPLEGARRPTHFDGVTTVVAKLFNIIEPDRAYFGQKDAQQAAVIKQMVRDLNFNLDIVVCPTVREPDGLAMSSRNKYLSAEQRAAAVVLYHALEAAGAQWDAGERDAAALRATMTKIIENEPLARMDYVSAAHPVTLLEWQGIVPPGEGALLSMAVYFEKTRLIDNLVLRPSEGEQS